MLQENKSLKSSAPADFDALATQFTALREELSTLTRSVASIAERRGRRMASDVSEGMSEAMHYAERKTLSAEADLERSVASHPYLALGLAAVAGLLVGAMTRR